MSIINHLDTPVIKKCPHCHKNYKQTITCQMPGSRNREDSICPYCEQVIETSMEKEFHNEKL